MVLVKTDVQSGIPGSIQTGCTHLPKRGLVGGNLTAGNDIHIPESLFLLWLEVGKDSSHLTFLHKEREHSGVILYLLLDHKSRVKVLLCAVVVKCLMLLLLHVLFTCNSSTCFGVIKYSYFCIVFHHSTEKSCWIPVMIVAFGERWS